MLLARSAAARRRVADRHLKRRQRSLMLDFRRRQRRVYLSKFTDLIAAKGVSTMRALVIPPKPKKSFFSSRKKEEPVKEEEPPKMLRYAPLSIVVEKGENLVAKDWSFRKATISASSCVETPSRHRCDSCPSHDEVGVFCCDFEAIRTALTEMLRAGEPDQ